MNTYEVKKSQFSEHIDFQVMQTEVKILTIVHPYESKFHPEAKFCLLQDGVNHTIFQVLFYGFSSVFNNDSLSIFSVLGIIPGAGGNAQYVTECYELRTKTK